MHLTPKARAFFSLAISERNVAFAKSSLAFGAGDSHVILSLEAGKAVRLTRIEQFATVRKKGGSPMMMPDAL